MARHLISLKVKCPHCGKSLMDHTVFLNANPSIKLRVEQNKQQGIINLCSAYGCFDKKSNIELAKDEIVVSFLHAMQEIPCRYTCM